jgi:AraC-like DNA-binding protein
MTAVGEWRTVGGLRVRDVRYLAGARQPLHRHAEGSLSLVLAGELEETSSLLTYRAAAGSLVLKPAGYRHANTYGPRGARVIQVQSAHGGDWFQRPGWRYRWHDAPRLARCIIALVMHGPAHCEAAELALWETLDEIWPECEAESTSPRPTWWAEAIDLLDDCTARAISVAAIARRVGVHPVYLARVSRRRLGCTVREYIRQRRVVAAWRTWERDGGTLASIASQVGFADQAHMTRAFASVLGVSPGRLRRLGALPAAAPRGQVRRAI